MLITITNPSSLLFYVSRLNVVTIYTGTYAHCTPLKNREYLGLRSVVGDRRAGELSSLALEKNGRHDRVHAKQGVEHQSASTFVSHIGHEGGSSPSQCLPPDGPKVSYRVNDK